MADHVARSGLPLALSDHPVLDANLLSRKPVGPAGDVAGGENPRNAGFQISIHRHPAIELQSGPFGQGEGGAYADPRDDEIGWEDIAVLQGDAVRADRGRRRAEVEDD